MLVKAKYEKDEIVTFKMANGDEIVAKVIGEDSDEFTVSKPMAVVLTDVGIKLVPVLFTGNQDKNIPLSKNHVMMHSPTVEQITAFYLKKTIGIEVLEKSKIIV